MVALGMSLLFAGVELSWPSTAWLRASTVIADFNMGGYLYALAANNSQLRVTIATHVKFGDACAHA